ncbi:MAG: ATP-binding cassette domain-containing protein [Bdellovibrionales bacterium]|nr:ATP-binding cassette domain-containing protein [Bdellovibrionales bacterium]
MADQKDDIALSVQNIHKSFGDKVVHRGVSFELHENEILGLFGGSGSGKSVILRSIIGLEHPDQGKIMFEGQDLTQLTERQLFEVRTHISYVFQNGALFDSLTVEDNLAYPLRAHAVLTESEIREKVQEMLQLVDMPKASKLLPAELSGGMQKRAGLARAIILQPRIVLFDEPTAGLDPVNTQRLLKNILDFKKRGMTGIFVTHDIPSAFEICDRIAILNEGKIDRVMTVDEMKKSNDPLVKSFTTGAHIR